MNQTPEQRARLRRLFDEARELAPPSQAAFLGRVRTEAGEAVAAQLEDLLKADDRKTSPAGGTLAPASDAPRDSAFQAGEIVLDRFQVVRLLARGGMGEVYEALDKEMGRVALKTIRHEAHGDRSMLRRFKQEVQLSRIVTSPHVCRVHELFTFPAAGFQPVAAFLTMEFLEGGTLAERIRKGPLPWREAEVIALQLCQGLDAIHKAGVIHRDLKSRNVMHTMRAGVLCAVITDLGLALEAGSTMTLDAGPEGTPGYMAPEQFESLPVSAATDIYALGVVLYEMVTGKHPFPAASPIGAAVRRAKRMTPASSLQPGLPASKAPTVTCLDLTSGSPTDCKGGTTIISPVMVSHGDDIYWQPKNGWQITIDMGVCGEGGTVIKITSDDPYCSVSKTAAASSYKYTVMLNGQTYGPFLVQVM